MWQLPILHVWFTRWCPICGSEPDSPVQGAPTSWLSPVIHLLGAGCTKPAKLTLGWFTVSLVPHHGGTPTLIWMFIGYLNPWRSPKQSTHPFPARPSPPHRPPLTHPNKGGTHSSSTSTKPPLTTTLPLFPSLKPRSCFRFFFKTR